MARIAIVGAGIAGLNAALTLQDAGLTCQIYEASGRIGGRMHSDTSSWGDGQVSEWCGEFVDPDHSTIHQLIQRCGLSTIDLGAGSASQSPSVLYFLQRYYDPAKLARDFQALEPVLQQQFTDAGYPTTYHNFTPEGRRLDHLSVYDWIAQYVVGGHTTSLGRLLDNACSGVYGLDTHEQSALNLVYLFGSRNPAQSAALPNPLVGRTKIVGGNEQLPLAISHLLPAGSIHLRQQLVSITRKSDATLALTFKTSGGTTEVLCDHAILALPFSTLRLVDYQQAGFDPLKKSAIEQLGYGTVSKLFLQFDMPYWDAAGPWPHPPSSFFITDLPVQTLWDASIGQNGPQALLVDYTSGPRGAAYSPALAYSRVADDAIIQRYAQDCLQHVEQVFPGISAHYTGRAALSYPTGDPYLLGSYSCWRVGQYTHFAGYEGVRQGFLHFAGEHCSVEYQGFMEGAAREGARAAQEIIQDIGEQDGGILISPVV